MDDRESLPLQKNSGRISEETSRRIASLRYLLIVLVVFIHARFIVQADGVALNAYGTAGVFNRSAFIGWIQSFISGGIAVGAVPVFFLFSGFLQAKKNDSYGTLLKKKARALLVPYFLWAVVFFFPVHGLKYIVSILMPHLLDAPENNFTLWTAGEWVQKLFGYRLHEDIPLFPPLLFPHFWFVRDLFIFSILAPFFLRLVKKYPVGFLSVLLLSQFMHIPEWSRYYLWYLFFFAFGLCWGVHDIPLFEYVDRISWLELSVGFVAAFLAVYLLGMDWNVMILFMAPLLLKLSALIVARQKLFGWASYLAGYSFFLYAIHCWKPFEWLQDLWLRFFPLKNGFFCLFHYFFFAALVVVLGTGMGIALKKICPPVFKLLTGGR